jgi:hypothetical protein
MIWMQCQRSRGHVVKAALYKCRRRSTPHLLRGAKRRFLLDSLCFELILHAVTFPLNDTRFRMMQQPIKDC